MDTSTTNGVHYFPVNYISGGANLTQVCVIYFTALLKCNWYIKIHIFNLYKFMCLDVYMYLWYRHHNQDKNHIITSKTFLTDLLFLCVWQQHLTWDLTSQQIFSAQYHILNCEHYVLQQISSTYSSCITVTLYPLSNNVPFFPAPIHRQPFYFMLLEVWLFLTLAVNGIMQYLSYCDWHFS